MERPLRIWLAGALLGTACAGTQAATTIVECVEADGTVSFRSACPPGTQKRGERQYATIIGGGGDRTRADLPPVSLYVVENCEPCNVVRDALIARNVPYTVKDITHDAALQQELREVSDGFLIPTLMVGDTALAGHDRAALDAALIAAGYLEAE